MLAQLWRPCVPGSGCVVLQPHSGGTVLPDSEAVPSSNVVELPGSCTVLCLCLPSMTSY